MAKHTFHLTPHASGRLYQFISSPTLRIIQLCFALVAILFFSIGVGIATEYVKPFPYWDLGMKTDFCQKLALGMTFLPVVWLVFLLVWHKLKKPKIHPGYYIGFDLFIGIAQLTTMAWLCAFSAYILAPDQVCESYDKSYGSCRKYMPVIRGLYCTAYAFGVLVSLMNWIFFGVACRVCVVYDREKNANKKMEKKGVKLNSRSRSSSQEHIV